MKLFKFFSLSLCLILVSSMLFAQEHRIVVRNFKQIKKFFNRTQDRLPMISAHRGGPEGGFPENCPATFANTLKKTFALIECDVQLSKDSQLVMMHDHQLERTSNGTGELKDFTLEELKKLKLKDKQGKVTLYSLPSLEDVLKWARGKTILTLDIKQGVPPAKVVEAILQNKAGHFVVIITYRLTDALAYHRLNPKLMHSVNLRDEKDFEALVQSGLPLSQVVAFTGVENLKQDLLDKLKKNNIYSILGTFRSTDQQAENTGAEAYLSLLNQGVDILATDRPDLASKALQPYFLKSSSKKKYFVKK